MSESLFNKYTDDDLLGLVNADIEQELRDRGYRFGWYKTTPYEGYIYILVNPAFSNLVKIGYADNIEKRVKSLNRNSGLPDPYHVYATYKVKKRLEDLKLHDLIDSLDSDLRHSKNREFYEMAPEKAYRILSAIAQINGDDDLLVLNPLNDDFFKPNDDSKCEVSLHKSQRSPLTFSMIGIKEGEQICFIEDPSIVAVVNGDRTVEFEGETWTLSGLTKELKRRNGTMKDITETYQGGRHFTYHGKRLTNIRKEVEKLKVSADV